MNRSQQRERRIRVYVVDDHHVVRAGLSAIFEDYPQIELAGEAADAATALRELEGLEPQADVALVDLRLPDEDGCGLCRRLKRRPHPPRVLILTSFGEEDNIVAAVGSGVDGYVLKTSEDDVLVAAITTVASGGTVWPSLARPVLRGMGQGERQGAGGARPTRLDRLSPQELRVLARIAEGKTNKEIGSALGLSVKTVRNHVSHLMRKLEAERRAQAAAYYVKFSVKPG